MSKVLESLRALCEAKYSHNHATTREKHARALAFQHGSKGNTTAAMRAHREADKWKARAKASSPTTKHAPQGTAKQNYSLPKTPRRDVKIILAKYAAKNAPPKETPAHLHKVPCSKCKTPHLRMNSHVTKSKSGKDVHTCMLCHSKMDTLGRNKHYVVPKASAEKYDWAPRDEIRLRWKKGKGPQAMKKKKNRKTSESLLVEIAGFVSEIDAHKHFINVMHKQALGKYKGKTRAKSDRVAKKLAYRVLGYKGHPSGRPRKSS